MDVSNKTIEIATNPKDVFHSGQLTTLKNSETLKGSASGETIGVDNISPVEHIMNVKVRGKNLANNYLAYPASTTPNALNGATITDEYIDIVAQSTYDYVYIKVNLEAGKTYTVWYEVNAYARKYENTENTIVRVGFQGYTIKNVNFTETGTQTAVVTYAPTEDVSLNMLLMANYGSPNPSKVKFKIMLVEGEYTLDNIPPYTPHIPDLSTATKNLFKTTNYSKGSILVADGSVHTGTAKFVETSDYIPLKAGTYTVSYKTGANLRYVCLYNKNKETIGNFWSNRKNPYTFTIDEDCLIRIDIETAKVDDVQPSIENYDTFFADFEVQLELGNTVTKYIPYVPDLSTVNVKTGGKNIFSYPYAHGTGARNGITWTVNSDGTIIANGTATAQSYFYIKNNISLQSGKMFVQGLGDSYDKGINMCFNNIGYVYVDDKTVNIPDGYTGTIYLFVKSGATVDNVLIKPPFACYNDDDIVKEYEVNSDGTVDGVTNLYPGTTLFTDTNGAIIDCNYYKDIDKTFDELLTNVALSGGEG